MSIKLALIKSSCSRTQSIVGCASMWSLLATQTWNRLKTSARFKPTIWVCFNFRRTGTEFHAVRRRQRPLNEDVRLEAHILRSRSQPPPPEIPPHFSHVPIESRPTWGPKAKVDEARWRPCHGWIQHWGACKYFPRPGRQLWLFQGHIQAHEDKDWMGKQMWMLFIVEDRREDKQRKKKCEEFEVESCRWF